jgi:hypothetical protein
MTVAGRHPLERTVRAAAALVTEVGIDDSEGNREQEIATGILRTQKAHARIVTVNVQEFEESHEIIVEYHLLLPVAEVVELSDKLTWELAGIEPVPKAANHIVHLYLSRQSS